MFFSQIHFIQFSDGEPIKLPDNLESLPRADHFPTQRHRWNTNEVSVFLICIFIDSEQIARLAQDNE